MLNRLFTIAAWGTLAFIAHATLSPIQDRPTVSTSPSFEHVLAFLVLGTLFCFAYPRRPLLSCMFVLGSAASLEAAQTLLPDRHARLHDLAEKLIGGVAGILLGTLLVWFSIRAWRRLALSRQG